MTNKIIHIPHTEENKDTLKDFEGFDVQFEFPFAETVTQPGAYAY